MPGDAVLVLWDVDRTLVDAAGVGVAAFAVAFRRLYGLDLDGLPVMAGRTDLAITLDAFRAHGLPESGLEAALAALRAAAAVQTLLTGNIKALALAKTRAFGLDGYLDLDI